MVHKKVQDMVYTFALVARLRDELITMPWKETTMINERTEFALSSLQAGVNFTQLCARYGISRRTGYKWKQRYLADGASAMTDKSRRPTNSPNQLTELEVCRITRLHERHKHWGPKKIHKLYSDRYTPVPSQSTFKRIFDKCGWVKKRTRRKSSETGRLASGLKAEDCNDVWTVDFKGWWRTGNGQRCEPLTVRDEHSRFLLTVQSMQTTKTEAVREVFERLFKAYGLPKAIRSDNGSPFASSNAVLGLSRLSVWWVALGIDLERGRPGKPQDNGPHERMHLDIRNELECHAQEDLKTQQSAFDIWTHTFNQERPHEALGMQCPAQIYKPSIRTYSGTPENIVYPGKIARVVNNRGYISLHGSKIPISTALTGWSVGLLPIDNDTYDVFFARLRLGYIEKSTAAFIGVTSDPYEGSALQRTIN